MSKSFSPDRRNHDKSEAEELGGLMQRLIREDISLEEAAKKNLLREKTPEDVATLRYRMRKHFNNSVLGEILYEEISLAKIKSLTNKLESCEVVRGPTHVQSAIDYAKENIEILTVALGLFTKVPLDYISEHGDISIKARKRDVKVENTLNSVNRCIEQNETGNHHTWKIVISILRVVRRYFEENSLL